MSLINELKKLGITFTLKYFGNKDLATGWDLKVIIEHNEIMVNYFENNKLDMVKTIDEYLDYFFIQNIIAMQEVIPYINTQENKIVVKCLIEKVTDLINGIDNRHIIQFINQNIELLFEEQFRVFNVVDVTIDYIIKFQSGISDDVFTFLISYHSYLIIDHYDDFQNKIEKVDKLFSNLFCVEIYDAVFRFRPKKYLKIIASIYCKGKKDFCATLEPIIDKIILEGEALIPILDQDNIIRYDSQLRLVLTFLQAIKHIKANDFITHVKKVQQMLDLHLKTNGHKISYEIPIAPLIDMLKEDRPWEVKLLKLTHTHSADLLSIESRLNQASKGKQGLLDSVSINYPTNDYFTATHQQDLHIVINVGSATILAILRDEKLFEESYNWYHGYIGYICGRISYMEEDLYDDLDVLYQMLKNIIYFDVPQNNTLMPSLCYGPSMFICSLTEKLLRIVYFGLMKNEKYVSVEKATIRQLLDDNNPTFIEVFGKYQMKHLRYFFCTDGEQEIGMNYRNNIAHWADISCGSLTQLFVARIMFLFTNVINSIFLYLKNCEIDA